MTKPRILLVDDREENLLALAALLKDQHAELLVARSGDEALELLLEHEIAVAVVDVQMPVMDGFMLAEMMRGTERTREIPIIFVTAGLHDQARVFKGYESGAVDFLYKPIDSRILNGKVAVFVRLHQQKQQLIETQRRLEQALAEAHEAACVRDRVISLVSHDLRSPLSSIAMQTALLRAHLTAGTLDDSIVAAALDRMQRGSATMEKQIGELLDVTQLQAGQELALEREDVDMVALAKQIAEGYARISKIHSIDVRSEAPVLKGRWDRTRLERVLDNLLSNAVKYSPDGGKVLVELRQRRDQDVDWVLVRVHDEGIGIPAHNLPRLFQWFARADNIRSAIRGTGLGLAGVRHIVMQHGGAVCVRSSEGQGSLFAIGLPMQPQTPRKTGLQSWEQVLLGD